MKQGIFEEKELRIIVTKDAGFWHLSVSHPTRYPTWDEIKYVRYKYLPNEITAGLLFPPKEEYINIHPNCFHLWEIKKIKDIKIKGTKIEAKIKGLISL